MINKMLRDLDSRQAGGTVPFQTPGLRTGIARDTLIVNDSAGESHRRRSFRLALLLAATVIVAVGGAGAWWYLNENEVAPRKMDQLAVAPTKAVSTAVIAVAPAAAPPVQLNAVEADIVTNPVLSTVDPANVSQKATIVPAPAVAKLPVLAPAAARLDMSLKMDSTLKRLPSTDSATRSLASDTPQVMPARSPSERTTALASAVPVAAMIVPPSPPRQSPALEALAQAQSLWSSGSREAAMDLLREALVAAERTNLASTSSGNNSVLAALARELARMELAEGRVSQALEMLTRLEPGLSSFADVWAMRGNAAQRLGRHPESVAAYQMALKLRPDEPRWMLGAAVSLAAQGQTAAAAELAEKARAGGVLSRELATYLRQLGVPLGER